MSEQFCGPPKGTVNNPSGRSGKLEFTCPVCGEVVGNIPAHLRHSCEGVRAGRLFEK